MPYIRGQNDVGVRGGLEPSIYPDRFTTAHYEESKKRTQPELQIFDGISATETSEPIFVGSCDAWGIYVQGTGTIAIDAAINPNQEWIEVVASQAAPGFQGSGANTYNWIRIRATAATDLTVWLHRRYATY